MARLELRSRDVREGRPSLQLVRLDPTLEGAVRQGTGASFRSTIRRRGGSRDHSAARRAVHSSVRLASLSSSGAREHRRPGPSRASTGSGSARCAPSGSAAPPRATETQAPSLVPHGLGKAPDRVHRWVPSVSQCLRCRVRALEARRRLGSVPGKRVSTLPPMQHDLDAGSELTHATRDEGCVCYPARSGLKKSRMSCASNSGSSHAAKCPPRGISVHRRTS